MKRHYHVFFQTVGCIPDDNDLFDTKAEAERYAIDSAADLRWMGRSVSGNAKTGYDCDEINRLYVEACTDPACLEETDR